MGGELERLIECKKMVTGWVDNSGSVTRWLDYLSNLAIYNKTNLIKSIQILPKRIQSLAKY